MRLRHVVAIAAPPQEVFEWIADPERARRWQPDVAGGYVTHHEPGMVGTRFVEVLADDRGRVEMRGQITAFEPGRTMAVRLEGAGMTVTARYDVRPHPMGSEVIAQQSVALRGLGRLVEPLVRRRVAARARADLQRLRSLCEAGTPPTT